MSNNINFIKIESKNKEICFSLYAKLRRNKNYFL